MREFTAVEELTRQAEAAGVLEDDRNFDSEGIWKDIERIEPLPEGTEAAALEPEIRYDVLGSREVFVTGNPFSSAAKLDYRQGDNPYGAQGNCGLVSIANSLKWSGQDITEDMVTKRAIEKGLCEYDISRDPGDNGGTSARGRQKVLKSLGIASDVVSPQRGGKVEDIADAVESGKGVVISGNAGVLWDTDDGSALVNGKPVSNHCVAVTGVARDASSGKIAGVYICDSGRGLPSDACRFLSRKELDDFYTNVHNSHANITRKAIREV